MDGINGDGQQRTLDALLSQSHMSSDNNGGKFTFAGGFEDDLPQEHAYSSNTPATQHEKLLYMNGNGNVKNESPYRSVNNSQLGSSNSFIDDKFATSAAAFNADGSRNSISNPQYRGSFAYDFQDNGGLEQQLTGIKTEDMLPPELFLRSKDELLLSFTDDISSSLGSSLQSFDSNYGSSFSYQPQPLNMSATMQPTSAHYSPSVKSPSSSVRAGSYLSTSLRNGSAGTPGPMGTSRTRHASISGNVYAEGLLSASVPKNLTTEERLRRKREFHNAVERRRRELIKQKIKELGNIVPPSLLNYDGNGKQVKPNKGIILNKTVEYLEYLLQVLDIQDRKKKQLLTKISELQDKESQLASGRSSEQPVGEIDESISGTGQPSQAADYESTSDGTGADACEEERIIDVRSKPHPSNSAEAPQRWQNSFNELNSFMPTNDEQFPLNDDLQQFLSGDLIEAEDNAKLMFNSGERPDYLLDFNS